MVKTFDFRHKTVFLDTAPLIYYIEGHSPFQPALIKIFEQNSRGDFVFIASTITLLEVLVKPLKDNRPDLVKQYQDILTTATGVEIIEVSTPIAIKAAELRAKYGLKTPDSISNLNCL